MNDYKNLLKLLFEKIERMRTEPPSAGTRFRLMGLTADIWEVAETLQKNVTACVSKELFMLTSMLVQVITTARSSASRARISPCSMLKR